MLVLKWLYLLGYASCIYWTMLVLKWLYLLGYAYCGYASIKVAVFIGLC